MQSFGVEVLKDFGIALVHPAKTPELAFSCRPNSRGGSDIRWSAWPGNLVNGLNACDDLYGER